MSFVRLTRKSLDSRAYPTSASTAYVIGAAQKFSSGNLAAATTGSRVVGVALGAKSSSDTSTNPVLVDIAHADDVWIADISSGTMGASSVGALADLSASTTITLTPSNNDCIIVGWDGKTTTQCYVRFLSTVFA